MANRMAQTAHEIATEHPHIVQRDGALGRRPHIRGTGLSVDLIARFYKMGATPDELLTMYPQLTPAALDDALSYYHDHQGEIDRALEETGSLGKVKARRLQDRRQGPGDLRQAPPCRLACTSTMTSLRS